MLFSKRSLRPDSQSQSYINVIAIIPNRLLTCAKLRVVNFCKLNDLSITPHGYLNLVSKDFNMFYLPPATQVIGRM